MRLPDLDWEEWLLVVVLLLLCTVLIGLVLSLFMPPAKSVTLDLSRWECTNSQMQTHTTMVLSGKTLVPITTTESVCVEWSTK